MVAARRPAKLPQQSMTSSESPKPLDTRTRRYFDRPYHVLDAGRFTTALRDAITDPQIQQLPATGAVDQHIDSTDAPRNTGFLRAAIIAASQPASA